MEAERIQDFVKSVYKFCSIVTVTATFWSTSKHQILLQKLSCSWVKSVEIYTAVLFVIYI
jgi:hypothetical protein